MEKRILVYADKIICKVGGQGHYTGKYNGDAHSIHNPRYGIVKDIPVVIYDRPNYDDDFIMKEIANNLKNSEFKCLGKNTEKCTIFSIQM